MLRVLECCKKLNYVCRGISASKSIQCEKAPKRKVKETVELVTLVDEQDKILGLKTKSESESLAKKLNLSLERVYDTKYGKMYPAYKMFSTAGLLKEEKKQSTAKVLKKLPLNSRITDHDLSVKLQTIRKWLSKNYEVHIAIMKNNESDSVTKKLQIKIQDEFKNESRILDVREKETATKFIMMPLKLKLTKGTENDENKDLEKS